MLGLTRLAIAIGLLVLLVFGIITLFKTIAAPSLNAKGPKDGALLGPAALAKLRFSAKGMPPISTTRSGASTESRSSRAPARR